MPSARQSFEEFIRWLHQPAQQVSADVLRLSNLILDHFDDVQNTSLQHSRRGILIAEIAQRSLAQTPNSLPEINPVAAEEAWPWTRLLHLRIGPFKGFRYPEPFDLNHRIVLIYGPNGSGKTSFCEALEYALLGSVEEADAKRITASAYLANIHEGRFEPPSLIAADDGGQETVPVTNADLYRFIFIEKNRIESFSRIAARPSSQRTELISTLFGMEKFNDFVNHFNDSLDGQLRLANTKQTQLEERRATLLQDQSVVDAEAPELQSLDREEQGLARTYSEGMAYIELKVLIGKPGTPGRLQHLNEILNMVPPQVLNITRRGLQESYESADVAGEEHDRVSAELRARADEVSFNDLYTAVIKLQPTNTDRCPACETPLVGPDHVLRNPYDKAAQGLEQLRELAELQIIQIEKQRDKDRASQDLRKQLETLRRYMLDQGEQNASVLRYLETLPPENIPNWWKGIYPSNPDAGNTLPTLGNIFGIADSIENQDTAARIALEARHRNINERDRLSEYQLLVQRQDLKRQQLVEKIKLARERIDNFEGANVELITAVASETANIRQDLPIKNAYDEFLTLLRAYRNRLPGTLMEGINETALALYNEFNVSDLDADKLAELHLPVTADQKIEICFRGSPGNRVDALKVLSEGHVRCLGLAILLAKSKSMNSPLIVFDDAINAIDHDHRRGIRETIFESDHFSNAQIILTCHSNEFIKDVHQSLNATQRGDSQTYLFRNHFGNYHPQITNNLPSRNYVEAARAARVELNDRGALDASRKALEMLAERIWRWLGSYQLGDINVMLVGVGAEPVLRNLCESLRRKLIDAGTFDHRNKTTIISALDRLLGIPDTNLVWTYLNKGTHEESDRDDFDRNIVEQVVVILEELESLDLRRNR